MPKFIIEREIMGAGKMSSADLKAFSQKTCYVIGKMGPSIQWIKSYVADDKICCVYIAPSEKLIRQHAAQSGFPANKISTVSTIIDPTSAE